MNTTWFAWNDVFTIGHRRPAGKSGLGRPLVRVESVTYGTVLQNPNTQIRERTVREEIAFPLKQRQYERTGLFRKRLRYDDAHIEAQVSHACDLMGFEPALLERDPILLPRPQRKLVTIAEALVVAPQILLLDEPTAGLGTASRHKIRELIARLREMGLAILLVENDVDFVAEAADTLTILDQGRGMLQGPVHTVFSQENWGRLSELHIRPPRAAQLAQRVGLQALTCDELVAQLSALKGDVNGRPRPCPLSGP